VRFAKRKGGLFGELSLKTIDKQGGQQVSIKWNPHREGEPGKEEGGGEISYRKVILAFYKSMRV